MELLEAPIDALVESPFNYRKNFSAEALQELALNIQSIGIQQPIKCRPHPDPQDSIAPRFEIVFGHRRYRAAVMANLQAVPIIVEPMSDEQVRIAQLSENIQREDTSPIEEAEGLRALIDVHGLKVDALVADTGKSRRHIYNTLRLLKLGKEAREALETKLIGREIAVLLSTLPQTLQARALDKVTTVNTSTGERAAVSFRAAKRILSKEMYVPIASASFDPENALLAKLAGACTTCPRLSQNDPTLRDDLDADLCTDPECFDIKAKAQATLLALKTKAEGGFVLEGEAADNAKPYEGTNWFHGYTSADSEIKDRDKHRPVREIVAEMAEAHPEEEPPAIGLHIDSKTHKPTEVLDDAGMERVRTYLSERNPQQVELARATRAEAHAARVFASPLHKLAFDHKTAIRTAARTACLASARTADEARMLAACLLDLADDDGITTELTDHFGWTAEIDAALEANTINKWEVGNWIIDHKLDALSPDDWSRLAVYLALECMPAGYPVDEQYPDRVIQLANAYDLDIEQIAEDEHDEDDQADEE